MSAFAVEPGELHCGDTLVAQACAQSRAAVARVRSSALEVLGAAWQGDAAAAFTAGCDEWLAGAAQMLDALDAMAALLGSSAWSYASTEAGVRADVARLAP